jgi:hypothetical protein
VPQSKHSFVPCRVCSTKVHPLGDDEYLLEFSLVDYLGKTPLPQMQAIQQALEEVLEPYVMANKVCVHGPHIAIRGDEDVRRDLAEQLRRKAIQTGLDTLAVSADAILQEGEFRPIWAEEGEDLDDDPTAADSNPPPILQ